MELLADDVEIVGSTGDLSKERVVVVVGNGMACQAVVRVRVCLGLCSSLTMGRLGTVSWRGLL